MWKIHLYFNELPKYEALKKALDEIALNQRLEIIQLKKEEDLLTIFSLKTLLFISSEEYFKLKEKELIPKENKIAAQFILLSKVPEFSELLKIQRLPIRDSFLLTKKPAEIVEQIKNLLSTESQARTKLPPNFVGKNLENIFQKTKKIIHHNLKSILITGESGTGKELVACCFKEALPQNTPFLKLNCASLSNELIESELFGYEKGSFTGAYSKNEGLLKKAEGGWVFMDEIACLPFKAQSSMLRFLESGEIRSVGESQCRNINVKILAATNEPLEKLVSQGKFRRDLYERLKVFELKTQPWRERDLEEKNNILNFLLKKIRLENNSSNFDLTEELRLVLLKTKWAKGNIRELKNALISLLIERKKPLATLLDLPKNFSQIQISEEKNIKTKVFSKPEENLKELKNKWLLDNISFIEEKEKGSKLNKRRLAKLLNLSTWKLEKQLEEMKRSQTLPEKYHYLLEKIRV